MIRMIIRLAMLSGVRHGIDWFFNRRAARQAEEDLTPEERRELQSQNKQQAKTTKRGFRVLRRFMRF